MPNGLAHLIIWLPVCIFSFGMLPQIVLNFRRKTTDGLSDYMILIFFFGYIQELIYTFVLSLPLAYKVMTPLGLLFALVFVYQRLSYGGDGDTKYFLSVLKMIGLLFVCEVPALVLFPAKVGLLVGWSASIAWATYQVPQFFKIIKLRSVEGLSLMFIVFYLVAQVIEALVALALSLPIPTLFNGVRGFFTSSSLLILFYLFRK